MHSGVAAKAEVKSEFVLIPLNSGHAFGHSGSGILAGSRVLIPLNSGHAFGPSSDMPLNNARSLNPFEFRACIRAREDAEPHRVRWS